MFILNSSISLFTGLSFAFLVSLAKIYPNFEKSVYDFSSPLSLLPSQNYIPKFAYIPKLEKNNLNYLLGTSGD